MNRFLLLLLFTLLLLVDLSKCKPQKYTTKYDNIDLDEIIKSDRLIKNYINCLMERGPCTPDGTVLKRLLPDGAETHCEKCTEAQKNGTKKIIEYLIKNRPEWWRELENKYDPTGNYRKKFEEKFEKLNA